MERKTLMLIFLPAVLLFILILALEKNVTVNRGKAIESAQRSAPVHEEYSASIDATRALRYVADARMYVRRKEIDSALHSLKEAENLRSVDAHLTIIMLGKDKKFLELCNRMAKASGKSHILFFADPLDLKRFFVRSYMKRIGR